MKHRQYASYHLHSLWSDGSATIPDMVSAADRAGLREVGVSDHFVLTSTPCPDADWFMPPERLADYIREVRAAATLVSIPVRLGLEVDFFPDRVAAISAVLDATELDYVIGGVHSLDGFPIDSSPTYWEPLTQDEVNDVYARYWDYVQQMVRSGLFDIVAHLDLPKKYGFCPTIDFSHEVTAVLDAVADADMVLELNAAGWDKVCAEQYPTAAILEQCFARGIPTLISADAHATGEVARHYEKAAAMLRTVGYRQTVEFEKRRRRVVPL